MPSSSSAYLHILDCLKKLETSGEEVRFINTYHGMPVSYPGRVLSVGVGRVEFYAPQPQIVCMRNDKFTYFKGKELISTVRASVIQTSMDGEKVLLRGFEYVEDSIGLRSTVRVETGDTILANIEPMGSSPFEARVREISLSGLMVITWGRTFDPVAVKKGTKMHLDFRLPIPSGREKSTPAEVEGTLVNVFLVTGTPEHRLGIETIRNIEYERLITRYISQRQLDLLKEIKSFCNK